MQNNGILLISAVLALRELAVCMVVLAVIVISFLLLLCPAQEILVKALEQVDLDR
jgi:hypothetical protein